MVDPLNIKEKYFFSRVERHNKNSIDRRQHFAVREVKTFSRLVRLSKLDPHFSFKQKQILDLGAGDQFLKPQIVHLQGNYNAIDYLDADFNKDPLPFPDKKFDCILSLAVIEHVPNSAHLLAEVYRILKPGGIFYLSTPNFRFCYKTFYDDPTHTTPFTDKSISKLLELSDFKNISVFPGLRCKQDIFYTNKMRFFISRIIPFKKKYRFCPDFLCGRSTSIFAICIKSKD